MKHSMLITGKNHIAREELFTHFFPHFECFTCSACYDDVVNHLHRFVPAVIVWCLQEEDDVSILPITELRETLESKGVILVAAGAKKDCDFFLSRFPKLAKFVFEKPLNPDMICDCLLKFMEKRDMDALLDEINALGVQRRIMVIDDDPFMLKLMTEYLKKEYEVETVTSGKQAMKYLADKTVDLILLDYEMPDESGPEVLERLHREEATKDIPVIFLTSIMYREMIEKALLLKPQGYLLKPVNREKLLEAIKNLLE